MASTETPSVMGNASILARVKKITSEQLGKPEKDIEEGSSFVNDLGADSLDTIDYVF